MKIDYKITTIVLLTILLMTYIVRWDNIFYRRGDYACQMGEMMNNNKKTMMHMMPDGKMMMNAGATMMDMTMNDMVSMMEGKTGKDLEKEFIVGMIPHHQGAVEMSKKLLLDKNVSQNLKDFAKQIITAQEGEIKMMNEWLKNY